MAPDPGDTICAVATPPGTAGIGIIRVSGPSAFSIADRLAARSAKTSIGRARGHTIRRARIVDADGSIIDDVLLLVFRAPRSYTGEDVVEISAHGGPMPIRRIMGRLLACGCRHADPGEFTQRAFLNGKMDLSQAEAVGDIIAARTEEAHQLARRQSDGRLSAQLSAIRGIVLGVLARIEASIDFPEETGELDRAVSMEDVDAASAEISRLLATADSGMLYREGLRLVLAGRPNVGKSSLMNALLRATRVIVTEFPGTTRDLVEETFSLRGIPIRAVDTAGLRETEDAIERIGIAMSREALESAGLVLHVCDVTDGFTADDESIERLLSDRPHLIVWNKWDLAGSDAPGGGIRVSAATGWNIAALEDAIAEAVLHGASPGDSAAAIITHERHRSALQRAAAALSEARRTLEAGLPADFVSIDLRGALDCLGEITGETATEDIISEIFSRFCIGK
jgi:tRNA modification GTPase